MDTVLKPGTVQNQPLPTTIAVPSSDKMMVGFA